MRTPSRRKALVHRASDRPWTRRSRAGAGQPSLREARQRDASWRSRLTSALDVRRMKIVAKAKRVNVDRGDVFQTLDVAVIVVRQLTGLVERPCDLQKAEAHQV